MTDSTDLRRIGIMGGTFDPVHYGHLVCADEARFTFSLDEVIFMPAGQPWQRRQASRAEDRYLMTVYATSDHEHFSVSRMEVDREGPTYTLDTLRSLREFYGEAVELFFITGADAVLEILTWKEPDAVLAEAEFIAATRPGYDLSRISKEPFADRIHNLEIPALYISSTDIRGRVRDGRPIRYLVPGVVARYIEERRLYIQDGAEEQSA